jgi:hypothetical protein
LGVNQSQVVGRGLLVDVIAGPITHVLIYSIGISMIFEQNRNLNINLSLSKSDLLIVI